MGPKFIRNVTDFIDKLSEWSKHDERLMKAVDKGSVDKIQPLIAKKKLNPTKVDPARGVTALHLAVCEGKKDVVNVLLSSSSLEIDTRDVTGRTALHCAVRNAGYEITQALLQHKANVQLVDEELLSVLHHACLGGHLGCIQLLLSCQTPIHLKDKNGRSVLAYAAWKGQASVCRLLMENGADVNDTDIDKKTPLMLAAERGNAAVCDYLIGKGATLLLIDKNGHDAIWFANKYNHTQVVKLLEHARQEQQSGPIRRRGSRDRRSGDQDGRRSAEHVYEPIGAGPGPPPTTDRRKAPSPPTAPTSHTSSPLSSHRSLHSSVGRVGEGEGQGQGEGDDVSNQYNVIDDVMMTSPAGMAGTDGGEGGIEFFGQSLGSFSTGLTSRTSRREEEEEGEEGGGREVDGRRFAGEAKEEWERAERVYEGEEEEDEGVADDRAARVEDEGGKEQEEEEEPVPAYLELMDLQPASVYANLSEEGGGVPRAVRRGAGGRDIVEDTLEEVETKPDVQPESEDEGGEGEGEGEGAGEEGDSGEDAEIRQIFDEGEESETFEQPQPVDRERLHDVGPSPSHELGLAGPSPSHGLGLAALRQSKDSSPALLQEKGVEVGARREDGEVFEQAGSKKDMMSTTSDEARSYYTTSSDKESSSTEVTPRGGWGSGGRARGRFQSDGASPGVYPLKSLKELAEKRAEVELEDSLTQIRPPTSTDKHSATQQKELESLMREKSSLVESCEDLRRQLSLAVNRQHWLHDELVEMQKYVDSASSDVDKVTAARRTAGTEDTNGQLAQILAKTNKKLQAIRRHIETLIHFEVEEIEDVGIYSSLDLAAHAQVKDPTSTSPAGAVPTVSKLERENRTLQFQLREAMRENKSLQLQMDEVEKLIKLARELKDENEGLIADYRKLKEVQDVENEEMEELEKIFLDTVDENNTLLRDNTTLRSRLADLERLLAFRAASARDVSISPMPPSSGEGGGEGEEERKRVREENDMLMLEIEELREAVGRQSQTILEMDERLRAQNTHAVEFETLSRTSAAALTTAAAEAKPAIGARQVATADTSAQTTTPSPTPTLVPAGPTVEQLEVETEARRGLERQYKQVQEEYDEMAQLVRELKTALDRKNAEVVRLNERISELASAATHTPPVPAPVPLLTTALVPTLAIPTEAETKRAAKLESELRESATQRDALRTENTFLKLRVEQLIRDLEKITVEREIELVEAAAKTKLTGTGQRAAEDAPDRGSADMHKSTESQTTQHYSPQTTSQPQFFTRAHPYPPSSPISSSSSSSVSDDWGHDPSVLSAPVDYRKSRLWRDLQRAMIETQKLLDKNRRLKQKLQYLKSSLGGGSNGGDGGAGGGGGTGEAIVRERPAMEQENAQLRRINEELMLEIVALKRTVDEQSIYMLHIGDNGASAGGTRHASRSTTTSMRGKSAPFRFSPTEDEGSHDVPDRRVAGMQRSDLTWKAKKDESVSPQSTRELRKVYEKPVGVGVESRSPSRSPSRSLSTGRVSVKQLSYEFDQLAAAEAASLEIPPPIRIHTQRRLSPAIDITGRGMVDTAHDTATIDTATVAGKLLERSLVSPPEKDGSVPQQYRAETSVLISPVLKRAKTPYVETRAPDTKLVTGARDDISTLKYEPGYIQRPTVGLVTIEPSRKGEGAAKTGTSGAIGVQESTNKPPSPPTGTPPEGGYKRVVVGVEGASGTTMGQDDSQEIPPAPPSVPPPDAGARTRSSSYTPYHRVVDSVEGTERIQTKSNGRDVALESLRKENAKLREEIEALRRTWCEYDLMVDQERDHYRAEIKLVKKRVETLDAEVLEKDAELSELTTQSREQKSELERASELQAECEEIVADYAVLLSELRESGLVSAGFVENPFEDGVAAGMSPFNELRACVRTYEGKEKERLELRERNKELEEEVEGLKGDVREKEEEAERWDREKEQETAAARREQESVQRDLRSRLEDLQRKFDAKSDEMMRLIEELETSRSDRRSLAEEAAILKERLISKEEELRVFTERVRREGEEMEGENERLRRLLEERRASPPPSTAAIQQQQHRQDLKQQQDLQQQQREQAMIEYEEQLLVEIDDLSSERNELRRQLMEKEQEVNQIKADLEDKLDALRVKLEATQARADRECSELLDDQDLLQGENERLRGELVQFERDFTEAGELFTREKERAANERLQLEEEIQRLREERERAEEERGREVDVYNINQRLIAEKRRLEEELNLVTNEKAAMSEDVDKLEETYRHLELFKEEISEQSAVLFSEKQALAAEVDATRRSAADLEAELRNSLRLLHEENSSLVVENRRLVGLLEEEERRRGSPRPSTPPSRATQPAQEDDDEEEWRDLDQVPQELTQEEQDWRVLEQTPVISTTTTTSTVGQPVDHITTEDTTRDEMERMKVEVERLIVNNCLLAEENACLRREVEAQRGATPPSLGGSTGGRRTPVITWSIGLQTSPTDVSFEGPTDDWLEEAERCEEEIQTLRSTNRSLSLHVAQLQYRLSQKLSGEDGEGEGDVRRRGRRRGVGGRNEEEQRGVERTLEGVARENLALVARMSQTEDLCDRLKEEMRRNKEERRVLRDEKASLKTIATTTATLQQSFEYTSAEELVERLREENNKLNEFIATLEDHIEHSLPQLISSTPLTSPPLSPISTPPPITMAPSSPGGGKPQEGGEGEGRERTGVVPGEQSEEESGEEKKQGEEEQRWEEEVVGGAGVGGDEGEDDEGEGEEEEHQFQLRERDRNYRDVVCSYRRHLLSSIQGKIDPRVKEALLQIIRLRQRQQQPHYV